MVGGMVMGLNRGSGSGGSDSAGSPSARAGLVSPGVAGMPGGGDGSAGFTSARAGRVSLLESLGCPVVVAALASPPPVLAGSLLRSLECLVVVAVVVTVKAVSAAAVAAMAGIGLAHEVWNRGGWGSWAWCRNWVACGNGAG